MANEVKVTNSEMELLRIMWETEAPSSVTDIRARLLQSQGWKATTVKTLLYNLRDKGAVQEVQRGVYRPVLKQSDVIKTSSREFIHRMFNGSAKQLVAALISNGELADEDIAELRLLLNKGENND